MNPILFCEKHNLDKNYNTVAKSYTCSECKKEYKKFYIENNKEKVALTTKNYNLKTRLIRQEWVKEDRINNPAKYKEYAKKGSSKNAAIIAIRKCIKKYGLTIEAYLVLIESCKNTCMICGLEETRNLGKDNKITRLSVDHCHLTNKVRGLLCFKCNLGLGKFKDDINLLQNAIDYLKKHQDVVS